MQNEVVWMLGLSFIVLCNTLKTIGLEEPKNLKMARSSTGFLYGKDLGAVPSLIDPVPLLNHLKVHH